MRHPATDPARWPGWDIARGIVLNATATGGYVLDGYGGIHVFATGSNAFPPGSHGGPYWSGWDIARGIVLIDSTNSDAGYVLDGYGGIQPFGGAPTVTASAGSYAAGSDIARGIAIDRRYGGPGVTVDEFGTVHTFVRNTSPCPTCT